MALYLDKRGKVTDVEGDGIWICSSCIDSGFMQDMAAPLPQGRQRHGGGGVYLSDLTNKERAAIVATQAQPPAAGTRAAYMAIPGVRRVIEVAPGHLRVLADHEVSEAEFAQIYELVMAVAPVTVQVDVRIESSPEQRVRELEAAEAEIRRELEDTIGRTPDPARSTVQLARARRRRSTRGLPRRGG